MKKTDLLIGFLIGLASALLGMFIFLELFTEQGFAEGISLMKQEGHLGKVITLGAILNIIVFFILLKKKKEMMARGVVLATIVLAIATVIL